MKYLTDFTLFSEKMDISSSDRPDEKLAKENLNELEFHLGKYPKGKQLIDQLYKSTKIDLEIEKELLKIVEYEIPPNSGKKINPFLSEYAKICSLEARILNANNQKIKAESDLQSVTDAKLKKKLNDDINVFKKDLQMLPTELKKLIAEHGKKMIEMKKKLLEGTAKIKNKV